MIKRLNKIVKRNYAGRRLLTVILALTLWCALMPKIRTQADQSSSIGKLSPALQQALSSNQSLVWLDPTKQTVRTLIQTYGPVSSSLTNAINAAGGTVVRQFTSINGLLVDLSKNQLLNFAARSDV